MANLISIVGPTASGKSALSLLLAKRLGAPIVSADSVQVYRGLDIGSGKVSVAEMDGIPHYLIDVAEPTETLSAGAYGRLAEATIERLHRQHATVLLVGGSGFYLQAVWQGFDEMPEIPAAVREGLRAELESKGLEDLVGELERVDPATFGVIDRRNPVRVLRALEVFRATGRPISEFRKGQFGAERPYRELKIGLEVPRAELYARIEARVDAMVAAGWVDEVAHLMGLHGPDCPGLQSLGYKELVAHLRGEMQLGEAVETVKMNTRRYAKRQMTWFRRYADIQWFGAGDVAGIWEAVAGFLPTNST